MSDLFEEFSTASKLNNVNIDCSEIDLQFWSCVAIVHIGQSYIPMCPTTDDIEDTEHILLPFHFSKRYHDIFVLEILLCHGNLDLPIF